MVQKIENVAIVGAGVMGADVALDMALNGVSVILKDLNAEALESARLRIMKSFRMTKMIKKGLKVSNIEEVLKLITFTVDYAGFENANLVVENIDEDFDKKAVVYKELNKVCGDSTIFAVNTSCISITKIGSLMDFPENVIGVHFMNPVPLKVMVETVRGFHTSKDTENNLVEFLKSIGKTPVVVNDLPGFVANRLSHLFMNEAAFVVQDQVADPAQVDLIFRQGYGHNMGPLETADLIGLDTVLNSLMVLYKAFNDPKFRPCPLLVKMVDAGLHGRKNGQGFYKY